MNGSWDAAVVEAVAICSILRGWMRMRSVMLVVAVAAGDGGGGGSGRGVDGRRGTEDAAEGSRGGSGRRWAGGNTRRRLRVVADWAEVAIASRAVEQRVDVAFLLAPFRASVLEPNLVRRQRSASELRLQAKIFLDSYNIVLTFKFLTS